MPVDNDISDNTYCHEGSLNLTQPLGFMNVDAETVHSWMSTMSNVRNSFHNQQEARIIFFFSHFSAQMGALPLRVFVQNRLSCPAASLQ